MMTITIDAGDKANFVNDIDYRYSFSCVDNYDADRAFGALAEHLRLNDPDKDLIDFQYLKADDVKSLLENAKRQGFISAYEIE